MRFPITASLRAHKAFDRISTGPLEGTHNKIKTLERHAYSYRDTDFFKLGMYALREAKWELIGA